jgi:hypothetical protein
MTTPSPIADAAQKLSQQTGIHAEQAEYLLSIQHDTVEMVNSVIDCFLDARVRKPISNPIGFLRTCFSKPETVGILKGSTGWRYSKPAPVHHSLAPSKYKPIPREVDEGAQERQEIKNAWLTKSEEDRKRIIDELVDKSAFLRESWIRSKKDYLNPTFAVWGKVIEVLKNEKLRIYTGE